MPLLLHLLACLPSSVEAPFLLVPGLQGAGLSFTHSGEIAVASPRGIQLVDGQGSIRELPEVPQGIRAVAGEGQGGLLYLSESELVFVSNDSSRADARLDIRDFRAIEDITVGCAGYYFATRAGLYHWDPPQAPIRWTSEPLTHLDLLGCGRIAAAHEEAVMILTLGEERQRVALPSPISALAADRTDGVAVIQGGILSRVSTTGGVQSIGRVPESVVDMTFGTGATLFPTENLYLLEPAGLSYLRPYHR